MEPVNVRVAIVGGGLAGASLANALVQLPGFEVHVFESAPEFSERGASVGLSAKTQVAMQQIIPSTPDLLKRAGGVTQEKSRILMGSGPDVGAIVVEMDGSGQISVHRASLLRELLAPLPEEVLHANKQLKTIQKRNNGKIELRFQDDDVQLFDVVIGADGVYSTVRHYVLQDSDGQYLPTPAGFWDCRVMTSIDKAKAALDSKYLEEGHMYSWLGEGAFLLYGTVGPVAQFIISGTENDPPKDRKRPLDRDYLNKALEGWLDGPIAPSIIDLILDQPNPYSYSQWEHKTTPTYSRGRVCIIGDAAHATSPWQAAGVGQAVEDVLILKTLLETVTSLDDIEAALKSYDAVRRPRCHRVIDSSRGTGNICCGLVPEVGLDPNKLKAALLPRWDFIFSLDFDAYKQEALEKMKEFQR